MRGGASNEGMNLPSIFLAVLAFLTGLVAAMFWYRSANIQIDLEAAYRTGDEGLARMFETASIIQAFGEAADLNRKAARWTAVSVLLSAAASLLGSLPP